MKKIHLTILEEDKEYAQKLALAIRQRERENIDVAWYGDLECYRSREEKHKRELLLIGESFQEEGLVQSLHGELEVDVVLLSGDGVAKGLEKYPIIDKYSSADAIVQSIYRCAADVICEDVVWPGHGKQFIGVYAPWNLELSMLFSFVLLQILAEKEHFLYVSLQEGLGRKGKEEGIQEENLADFISFMRMGKGSMELRLKSICKKFGRGSCIPSVDNPQNISDMTQGDYRMLWKVLCNQSEYEGILMEFGSTYEGMFEDMKRCQVIYCPYQDDVLLMNRRVQMKHVLELHKAEELTDRMQDIKMPRLAFYGGSGQDEEYLAQELLCSEFGDTVRGLVNGYGR